MSHEPKDEAAEKAEHALRSALALTRDRELDCEEFLEHLAELIDGRLVGGELEPLMEHHRTICPDCEEERQILQRAVAGD
jgi:hypothetical protein